MMAQDRGDKKIPLIEAPLEIIEYYNKGKSMDSFKTVGYFIIDNVAVCEKGKKEVISNRMHDFGHLEPYDIAMKIRDGHKHLGPLA